MVEGDEYPDWAARFVLRCGVGPMHDRYVAELRAEIAQAERRGAEVQRESLAGLIALCTRGLESRAEATRGTERCLNEFAAQILRDLDIRTAPLALAPSEPEPAPAGDVRAALEAAAIRAQLWVDAVERNSSWDGWDHHYKAMKYELLPAVEYALGRRLIERGGVE